MILNFKEQKRICGKATLLIMCATYTFFFLSAAVLSGAISPNLNQLGWPCTPIRNSRHSQLVRAWTSLCTFADYPRYSYFGISGTFCLYLQNITMRRTMNVIENGSGLYLSCSSLCTSCRNFSFLSLPLHGLLIPCERFARCLQLCFLMTENCRIAENAIDAKEFSALIEMREAK